MKSILTVLGTFIFCQFIEAFVRIVILLYNQQEFVLYGLESIPGSGWVAALLIGIFTATWLAGMFTVTIIPHSPLKHLSMLFVLLILRRVSEFFQIDEPYAFWYIIAILALQFLALTIVFLIHKKSYAQTS